MQSHYQNYFKKNKNNQDPCEKRSMKLCIVKKLAKQIAHHLYQTIKNILQIAEHHYCTSIGKSYSNKKKTFFRLFKGPKSKQIFHQATTAEEVRDIIMTLIGSKSTASANISIIFLKQTRNKVFLPLANIINQSFESGIFPDIFKGGTYFQK